MANNRIAIAGITGKLGQRIALHLLQASPTVTISGYCRTTFRLPQVLLSDPRVSITKGFSDEYGKIRQAIRGCHTVICAYNGASDFMVQSQRMLIDACEAEDVARYVASDFGVDYHHLQPRELPTVDAKLYISAYLEQQPSLQGVHIFLGTLLEAFFSSYGVWDPASLSLSVWGTSDEGWDFTTYNTAAKYIARVALDRNATGNLKFRDERASIREIAFYLREKGLNVQMRRAGTMNDLQRTVDSLRSDPRGHVMPLFETYYIQSGRAFLGDTLDNRRYPDVLSYPVRYFVLQNDLGLEQQIAR